METIEVLRDVWDKQMKVEDFQARSIDFEHREIWNLIHPLSPVRKGEIIHHIDGNHLNNDPENLEKVPNSSIHLRKYKDVHKKSKTERTKNKLNPPLFISFRDK